MNPKPSIVRNLAHWLYRRTFRRYKGRTPIYPGWEMTGPGSFTITDRRPFTDADAWKPAPCTCPCIHCSNRQHWMCHGEGVEIDTVQDWKPFPFRDGDVISEYD